MDWLPRHDKIKFVQFPDGNGDHPAAVDLRVRLEFRSVPIHGLQRFGLGRKGEPFEGGLARHGLP